MGELNIRYKKWNAEDIFFAVATAISFAFVCALMFLCINDTIWYDESYTMWLSTTSYHGLIIDTACDVHPPLYYAIIKFFLDPLRAIFPGVNIIILAKFISIFGFVSLFLFAYYVLPKVLPKTAVGFFMLLLFAFSNLDNISLFVRMYGFAMLFVTIDVYYFARIVKFGKTKDWVCFVIFFECAAYSHNFALVAVGCLLLYLLIYFIFNDRKNFKKAFFFAYVCFTAFVPWLIVLSIQFTVVHNGYWIPALKMKQILNILSQILCPNILYEQFSVKIAFYIIVALALLAVSICVAINKRIAKREKWVAFSGFFVTLLWLALGLGWSILVDPILTERYISVLFGAFLFSLTYTVYLFCRFTLLPLLEKLTFKMKNARLADRLVKGLKLAGGGVLAILIVVSSGLGLRDLYAEQNQKQKDYEYARDFIAQNSEAYFVFENMEYSVATWEFDIKNLYQIKIPNNYWSFGVMFRSRPINIIDFEQLEAWVRAGETVYFFEKTDFGSELAEHNLVLEFVEELAIGDNGNSDAFLVKIKE